jgi:hypothetical protein
MKINIFAILFFFATVVCNAQLILETSNYPNLLKMIHLEYSGFKYALHSSGQIRLYNLNHTLYKTINIPPISMVGEGVVQYISETLWDTDSSDVDYAFLGQDTTGTNFIRVFHENGNLIFSRDSASFYYGIGQDFGNPLSVPIINTDSGTKMILWCGGGHNPIALSNSSVYCLPGHLECLPCYNTTCAGQITGMVPLDFLNQTNMANPYPNPTGNVITIPITLPEGENSGEIILHDIQGAEIKRYKVDRAFSNLVLNSSDLNAGTYFYQLVTSKGVLGSKKVTVIK